MEYFPLDLSCTQKPHPGLRMFLFLFFTMQGVQLLVLALQKKGKNPQVGTLLYTCECDDERACYLIIKKHVYSKTKYVNIPSFHSSHHFNSTLKLKFRQSTFVI